MNTVRKMEVDMPVSKTTEAEYMKIRRHVLNLICKAGSEPVLLPTALELSKQFGVCRQTVGKALKLLAEENYVIGRPGMGTFTNPKRKFRFNAGRNPLTIGIILSDGMIIEMDEYLAKTVAACLVEASVYPAFVRTINLTSSRPDTILQELKNEFLDALIWQNPPSHFLPLLERIEESGIAIIVLGGFPHADIGVSIADFDFRGFGCECGRRLLEAGKRQIVFLRDERPWNYPADGIRQAFREADVPLNEKLFLKGGDILDKLRMIFELGVPVDAIVNPLFPYEDLAEIAGRTDFDLSRTCHVCWDSVAGKIRDFHGFSYSCDFAGLAKEAVNLLRLQLEKKDRTPRAVLVPLEIHEIA